MVNRNVERRGDSKPKGPPVFIHQWEKLRGLTDIVTGRISSTSHLQRPNFT